MFLSVLFIMNLLPTDVFAADNKVGMSAYQFDGDINKYLEEQIYLSVQEKMNEERTSEWYVEYEAPVYVKSHGYAGNQPTAGTSFGPTGGGFYYSEVGGPTVTATASIGGPWGNVSFSVDLGRCSSNTGYIVNAPAGDGYYKLYVNRTTCIKPYTLFTKHTRTTTWNKQYLTSTEVFKTDFEIHKVS